MSSFYFLLFAKCLRALCLVGMVDSGKLKTSGGEVEGRKRYLLSPHPLPNLYLTSWKHNITQREAQALELAHQSNRKKEAREQQG